MKRWCKGLLGLLLFAAMLGCIPTQQQLRTERDFEEMKRRLAEMERSVAAQRQARQGEDALAPLAKNQADLQAGLDTLRVEFQSLSGRIQDQSRERDQLRSELALVRDDLGLKAAALEDRLDTLEKAQQKIKDQAQASPPPAPAPEVLYAGAVELIQKKQDFPRARTMLEEFLQGNPRHHLTVNAMYWIGESYYGEKKYENAILQFQDVIQKYGDHPKVASALYKQGLSFHALGDNKNAKVILKKVSDTFPLSEEAKRAKEKLATIK